MQQNLGSQVDQQDAPGDARSVATRAAGRRGWWAFWSALALAAVVLDTAADPSRSDSTLRYAYLDPGAGSFVIQALVAMLAGVAVTVKVYWHRIRVFLGLAAPEDEEDETSDRRDDE
jgi:hypothetical protein